MSKGGKSSYIIGQNWKSSLSPSTSRNCQLWLFGKKPDQFVGTVHFWRPKVLEILVLQKAVVPISIYRDQHHLQHDPVCFSKMPFLSRKTFPFPVFPVLCMCCTRENLLESLPHERKRGTNSTLRAPSPQRNKNRHCSKTRKQAIWSGILCVEHQASSEFGQLKVEGLSLGTSTRRKFRFGVET